MQKLFIKVKWLLFVLFSIAFVITAAINVTLFTLKDNIADHIQKVYKLGLSYDLILYVPPNIFITKNLKNVESSDKKKSSHLSSWIIVKTSLKNALKTKEITFNKSYITFLGLSGNTLEFFKKNQEPIRKIVDNLDKNDITFDIRGMEVFISKNSMIKNDMTIAVKGNSLSGQGAFLLRNIKHESTLTERFIKYIDNFPTHYSINLIYSGETLLIDNIKFAGPHVEAEMWGNVNNQIMGINGFALFKTTAKIEEKPTLNDMYQMIFNKRKFSKLTNPSVFLVDLTGEAQIQWPEIDIKNVKFLINKIPAQLKGKIRMDEPYSSSLEAHFTPAKSAHINLKQYNSMDINLNSSLHEGQFTLNGKINVDVEDNPEKKNSVKNLTIKFENLMILIKKYARYVLRLDRLMIDVKTNIEKHRVDFKALNGFINDMGQQIKYVEFQSPFYEGTLTGKCWVDFRTFPVEITSEMHFKGINANKIEIFPAHFSKVHGILDSEIHYYNYPKFYLKGSMEIVDGKLKDYEFFKWLAETFDLKSLTDVDFKETSADFIVNLERASMYDIALASEKINIDGYYNINKNGLINSKISLYFNRNVLKESRKFRPIINMFNKKRARFNFDFQLSGNESAMNFLWLDSDIKKGIQEKIPDFMERGIEQNIAEMIQPEDPTLNTDINNNSNYR